MNPNPNPNPTPNPNLTPNLNPNPNLVSLALFSGKFLPFEKALLHARALNLKNMRAWEAWRKCGERPVNIPSNPHTTYKYEGWQGYGHWLGTGNAAPKSQLFLPFAKALLYARSLRLTTQVGWQAWSRRGERPVNLKSLDLICAPYVFYGV